MYMRVLAITNMYPNKKNPAAGRFIEQQIKGLNEIGMEVDIFLINRLQEGKFAYIGLGPRIRQRIESFNPDIVHCMYGGIMGEIVTRIVGDKPVVVTFHGSDLLGENQSGLARKLVARCGVWGSKRAALRAAGGVVVSKKLQGVLPKRVELSKVRVIPCGIDLDFFKPMDQMTCLEQLGWDPSLFHILFQNSRDPVKRILWLMLLSNH